MTAVAEGRRLLSGTQALVELPLLQRRMDDAAGLATAGFVSGYRGSPLGGYDAALAARRAELDAAGVRFEPGLNEDLAATAVWGTQQVGLFPGATVKGVFGIWYGKGPGVDRSLDVLKHANAAGTSPLGGVLAVAGDDHGCVSSTLPHQSGPVFEAALMPVLVPASVAELIGFGLAGIAMSRASGCWVGMTAASEVVETTAGVDLGVLPSGFVGPPGGDFHIRWPDPPLDQERRLLGPKLDAVRAFAEANGLDRMVIEAPGARLAIVTCGKAHGDVMEALALLGHPTGVRVVKIGLAWPLGDFVLEAVAGVEEVLVVEEKRAFVETQLARRLRLGPRLVGKTDEDGRPLLPAAGELSRRALARVIGARLARLGIGAGEVTPAVTHDAPGVPKRAPYYCAGCPHSGSTRIPEGSRAMAGIGCHGMAIWMPERNTQLLTQMGGEGVTWIGQAPFTTERHVFQNMGDGTYNHSGLLAIRAAVAAGVNVTYKILFNDAVAMTGGQAHDGALTVPDVARQLLAENVRKVVVVGEGGRSAMLPADADWHERGELDTVQRTLRDTPGVTALIYEQTCAAELRRRRRKGEAPVRARQVFINPEVCEACGDCSVQSNCLAVVPRETALGIKRRIDETSCNQDYSCIEGFCPSFVTVETSGGTARAVPPAPPGDLPDPVLPPLGRGVDIAVAGIGGTGVVTLAAVLGRAADAERLHASILDVTGLSQKNGAVLSQVRIAAGAPPHGSRITEGAADLLIACDVAAAAAPATLALCSAGTRAIANAHMAPTAAFVREAVVDLGFGSAIARLRALGGPAIEAIDATALAIRLTGSGLAANMLLLGHAWQRGLIPLRLVSIEAALDGLPASAANRAAFAWGRAVACGRTPPPEGEAIAAPATLEALIEDRVARLTTYQNAAYAGAYRQFVEAVRAWEAARVPGREAFTDAVARQLYRLMAHKDEYEVARLHLDVAVTAELRARFGEGARLGYHLAPPFMGTRKRRFGPWIRPVFRGLAAMRGLRGTPLDPFGWTAERRAERRLVDEYRVMIQALGEGLTPANHAHAVNVAAAAALVRGYGHVRARSIRGYREQLARLHDTAVPNAGRDENSRKPVDELESDELVYN